MEIKKLKNALALLTEVYAEKNGAKKPEYREEKDFSVWRITLNNFALEFVYALSEKEDYPASTLFLRLFPDKSDSFSLSIYDIISYLDIYDYHCYCFSYIEDERRLNACFSYITDFIAYHYDEIEQLASQPKKYKDKKLKELCKLFDIKSNNIPKDEDGLNEFADRLCSVTEAQIIQRYTKSEAYIAYLSGDYEKSLELYGSQEKKTEYENKLVAFISGLYAPYQAIPEECASVVTAQNYNKENHTDLKKFVLSLVLFTAAFSIPFFIAQVLINAQYSKPVILANTTNPLLAVCFGILPGVFASLAFGDKLKLLSEKKRLEAIRFVKAFRPQPSKRIFVLLFAFFTIASVVIFSSSFSRPSVVLYKDRFLYDDGDTFFAQYEECSINSIWEIYYAEGRYKKNEKYVKKPSYIIQKADGTCIDTYSFNLSGKEEARFIYELKRDSDREINHIISPDNVIKYF